MTDKERRADFQALLDSGKKISDPQARWIIRELLEDIESRSKSASLFINIVGDLNRTMQVVHLLLRDDRVEEAKTWVINTLQDPGCIPEFMEPDERAKLQHWAKERSTELNVDPLPWQLHDYEDRASKGLLEMPPLAERLTDSAGITEGRRAR